MNRIRKSLHSDFFGSFFHLGCIILKLQPHPSIRRTTYCCIPKYIYVIVRNDNQEGHETKLSTSHLDPIDMNIFLHLASYWWLSDKKSHPSKKTIANAMGVHPRTVQRHIADLEKKQLIKREQRRIRGGSDTNLYHFDGLIAAALPFAKEKLERKKRCTEALQKPK